MIMGIKKGLLGRDLSTGRKCRTGSRREGIRVRIRMYCPSHSALKSSPTAQKAGD